MLLTPEQLFAFLPAAVLITLSPGPDNLMVLSLGIARGRRAGMVFGLGCALGCLSHTLLAALGISALLAATPWALQALKIAGGGYLIWLGWQALRSSGSTLQQASPNATSPSLSQLFGKGLIANAINPKVVLFFLAFLPQFIQGMPMCRRRQYSWACCSPCRRRCCSVRWATLPATPGAG